MSYFGFNLQIQYRPQICIFIVFIRPFYIRFGRLPKKFWKYRKPILQWKNTFEAGFLPEYWKLSKTAPMPYMSYGSLPSVTFSEFLNRCLWRYLALKLFILFLTNQNAPRSVVCFTTLFGGARVSPEENDRWRRKKFASLNCRFLSLISLNSFNLNLLYKI